MTIVNDTRVVRLQRVAARTGHQHSADERIVEQVTDEIVTAADVVSLPPGSLITLQRGPGSGHTEEGSVLNASDSDIGGVAGGQSTSVSFDSEDAGVTAASVFQNEIDYTLSLSSPGDYAVNYKTFQIKTYTPVPTTPGSRTLITYAWAPIREYLEWTPEDLDPDLVAFGVGPHIGGGGSGSDAYVEAGCNIHVDTREDGYKVVSLDIQSIAGEGLVVSPTEGCPELRVDLDAYQVGYDDSENKIIFADNVQDAIKEIDGYINVGEVVQIRKYGSEAADYPNNTAYTTDGAFFPIGSGRVMAWVNGIPLFEPDDYIESGSSSIQLTSPIDDTDIVDIWILPRYLGVRDQATLTLQEVYDNTNILEKFINTSDEGLSLIQSYATGYALRLKSDTSLTPSLVVTQEGTGEGIRVSSVGENKSSVLVQKDTVSRNTESNTVIVERTTSHISGGQTGIGSSILTRLENSGTILFDASKIITGTLGVSDSAENSYIAFEVSDDGILGEKVRISPKGHLGVGVDDPDSFIIETEGDIGPHTDNVHSLGSVDNRWKDGYFGPDSIHIVSKDGETPSNHIWSIKIDTEGNLKFDDGDDNLIIIGEEVSIEKPLRIKEGAEPSQEPGYGKIYASASGDLYYKSSSGSDTKITQINDISSTQNEDFNYHSDAINTIRKDLDGYQEQIDGLDNTVQQHKIFVNNSFDTILKDLDGYSTTADVVGKTGDMADGYLAFWANDTTISGDNDLFYNRETGALSVGGATTIAGNSDASQLIVKAFEHQSNTNQLIQLQNSAGTPICNLHSDNTQNVFLGIDAGIANDQSAGAIKNVFVGYKAAEDNYDGHTCIAIGQEALRYNYTGNYNVALGAYAGRGVSGQSPGACVFVGYQAGYKIETGTYDIFFGNASGYSTTTGIQNTGIGSNSLYSNTTGGYNIGIGSYTMRYNQTGNYNIAFGYQAGMGVTGNSPGQNVFVGYRSGFGITTGTYNIFFGSASGYSTTDGTQNVGIGANSLYYNTSGEYNIGFGAYALRYNQIGDNNIAFGYQAGMGVTGNSYSNNIFIGRKSGFAITTGGNNICLGYQSGDNLTTGANNILIGYDLDASAADVSNELNIGSIITGDLSGNTLSLNAATTIAGQADETQLIVKANATQSNANPIINIQDSAGSTLFTMHSDHIENLFVGDSAGIGNTTGTKNAFIGNKAAQSNTEGSSNISFGYESLYYNQTGNYNVAIGIQAGRGASGNSHSQNVFLGFYAGYSITTGNYNSFVGPEAGQLTTTGDANVAMSKQALRFNTTGNYNIALGLYSLYRNVDGNYNIAFGFQAGYGVAGNSGNQNTFIGYLAGYGITTGNYNIAFGTESLRALTSADANMAIGRLASRYNTTGQYNMALGTYSLHYNVTGAYNIAIGANAGRGASGNSHNQNIFIGYNSGYSVTEGSYNLCSGVNSGYNLTTGENNICLGYQAGDNLTTGSNNIIIGYNLDASAVDVSNELNIGGLIKGNTSDKYVVVDGHMRVETAADEGQEAVVIDQNDSDQPFINFNGSAGADTTSSISTNTTPGSAQGFIQIEINGTKRWIPFYDDPS